MIRALLSVLLIALGLTAAEPAADPPAPAAAAPAPASAGGLAAGGLLRTVLVLALPPPPSPGLAPSLIDRIAGAVEGAESSHGRDPMMWRADPRGPQGPMQVTHVAALDVGGGDRFDLAENRALGRAYLTRMYERYGNWPDSLMAYNWGPGNLDLWIKAGRRADGLAPGVSSYVSRVLADSEAEGSARSPYETIARTPDRSSPPPREVREDAIADPALRKKVADNNRLIAQLRILLDAASRPSPGGYAEPTMSWLQSAEIDPAQLIAGEPGALLALRRAGGKLVFAVAQEVAQRPDFNNFKQAKRPTGEPEFALSRLIASVLLARLEEANATLALVDDHKRPGAARPAARAPRL